MDNTLNINKPILRNGAMKVMTREAAIKYMEDNYNMTYKIKNGTFAVRGDDYIPKKKFRKSWSRPDDTKTHTLPGVSAMQIDMWVDKVESMPDVTRYGKNTFLLIGEIVQYGDDIENQENITCQEIVLKNHKIIAIINNE